MAVAIYPLLGYAIAFSLGIVLTSVVFAFIRSHRSGHMKLLQQLRPTKSKLILSLSILGAYLLTFLICRLFFANSYPASWITEHFFLFIWLLSPALAWFGLNVSAVASAAGCLLGIPIATAIGNSINNHYTALAEANGPDAYHAYLYHAQDVPIWLECTLIPLIAGLLIDYLLRRFRPAPPSPYEV